MKFANTNEITITLSVPIVNLEDFEEEECYKQIENLHNFKQTNNEDLSNKVFNNFFGTTRAQKRIQQEKAKNLDQNETQEKLDKNFSSKPRVKK